MIVYVETNFVLELALQQEEHAACERALDLARNGTISLRLPAFSLAEAYRALEGRHRRRRDLSEQLNTVTRELTRSRVYQPERDSMKDVAALLARSTQEDADRLVGTRQLILDAAVIIPLDVDILESAAAHEKNLDLSPPDAIVYASVLSDLGSAGEEAVFLNRNTKDFENPDIEDELQKLNCKLIPSFKDGVAFATRT